MIKVQIAISKGDIKSIEVKGHAGYGPYGHDIVCAGVSAITIGGINALKHQESFDIITDSGIVVIKAKSKITKYDVVVLNTIVEQLQTIEASYKNHIKINLERT